jgi:hypothetical protein
MSLSAFARRLAHTSGRLDASRTYITMWDDITVSVMPTGGAYAYAGYVDGMWPTFPLLVKRFPNHRLFSIAVFSSDNAECLDVERGDARNEDAPGWFERQIQRGVWRPGLYTQASNLKALELEMRAHHVPRSSYRLWSAHYTGKPHLCGPKSCGYGLSESDGTQWTSSAMGINLDRSLLLPDFFDPRPVPPRPPAPKPPHPEPAPAGPTWEEAMMNRLPTLKQGDKDGPGKVEFVGRMQALIQYIGQCNNIEAAQSLKVDGDFGAHSVNALLAIQAFFGLHNTSEYQQRVCGPKTWPALVTAEP